MTVICSPLAERAGLLILGVDPDALLPAVLELAQPGRDQRPHWALCGMHNRMRRRCVLGAGLRWCIWWVRLLHVARLAKVGASAMLRLSA
jgi:hypothetical protein